MTEWWLSTEKMTVSVTIKDGIIIEATPATLRIRAFIGQPFANLVSWLKKQPEFKNTVFENMEYSDNETD